MSQKRLLLRLPPCRRTASPLRALETAHTTTTLPLRLRSRMSSSAPAPALRLTEDKEEADYAAALAKLELLTSNRAVTTAFDRKAAAKGTDMNAQAIPEMREWLRRAGYSPQDLATMRHIHVAGTKGKGSICAFAASILRAHYRVTDSGGGGGGAFRRRLVGTYTSPHLVSPRERIAIDGEPVSRAIFAAAVSALWERFTAAALAEGQSRAAAEGPCSKPFYFRFLTILAWHIFLAAGVRDVVMECGIGGEHDATNVLPATAVSAAVVAQLGNDHAAMLGGSTDSIAWHKAGIFKPGVAAFVLRPGSGQQQQRQEHRRTADAPSTRPPTMVETSGVMAVLRSRAAERGVAELVELGQEDVDAWPGVESELGGAFQKKNQALAVLAVQEHLGLRDRSASTAEMLARVSGTTTTTTTTTTFARGLGEARLRGRCEVIRSKEIPGTKWMLDGAHTTDSIEEVARWLMTEAAQSGSVDGGMGDDDSKNKSNQDSPVILVFNQQERDAPALLTHLVKTVQQGSGSVRFSHALFTRNELAAPAPADSDDSVDVSVQEKTAVTMKALVPDCEVRVLDNVRRAVAAAREIASSCATGQRILVTGSLHLVGGVLRMLEPDSLL